MKRIGLLSDTHGFLDESVFRHFSACDEIWHAGDIGDQSVIDALESFKPLKVVFGNIDNHKIRLSTKESHRFQCEGLDVWMTHIGGRPGNYAAPVRAILKTNPPQLFVCGHSHICMVKFDQQHNMLYMNPGAAGKHGFHQVRTMMRFSIDSGKLQHAEVIELGKRA